MRTLLAICQQKVGRTARRTSYRGRAAIGSSGLHQFAQHLEALCGQVAQRPGGPLAHVVAVHREGDAHLADGQVDLSVTESRGRNRKSQKCDRESHHQL